MSPAELDALARRANQAGYDTIPDYCAALVRGLAYISDSESGHWGSVAYRTLRGEAFREAKVTL